MTKRKFTTEDLFAIELVGDNARHPHKPIAAVVVQRVLEKDNSYQSHIWMVDTEKGTKTPFTVSEKSETSPAWSRDGEWLAFLSNRQGEDMQLYLMRESGGEAVCLTDVSGGVQSFRWSPDVRSIAFTAKVETGKKDLPSSPAANSGNGGESEEESPRQKYTKDVRRIRKSFYRLDGPGFFGDKYEHIHLLEVSAFTENGVVPAKGQTLRQVYPYVQLTSGDYSISSYDFSPDGKRLVVSTNIEPDAETTFETHLYELELPEPSKSVSTDSIPVVPLRCLTKGFHQASMPRFSADGRFIAFKGDNQQFGPTTVSGLYLFETSSGNITWLTEETDAIFTNSSIADTRTGTKDDLQWTADSQSVLSLLSERGTVQLVRVDLDGTVHYLTRGEHCVLSYSLSADGEDIIFTAGTSTDPANIYAKKARETQGHLGRMVTNWNDAFLDTIEVTKPERFTFESDGLTLDGWVMLPSEPAPKEGYPTVLQVHGGPQMMYSESFFFEFQLLAAQGMAVIYTNPRGSVGYGQEFTSCIEMDWGNLDYRDVMKLADTAISRYPLSASQMAIAGGSYGGFMSAWAIGHTDRFRAAVVMRAVINWYSMLASDIGYISPALEFGGKTPWEDPERYLRISPITYANHVNTSTLIIHSENDYRCPIDQGEQFYLALRLRGVPVEFLRFPNESHGLSRGGQPWHRIVRLEEIVAFLKRELEV